ncbi:uncharacterized protein PAC_19717 [Phialocephala subalpina]|uniref:Heterokaryon incompatibility domain-containing protein n=1 Tax=Phialocephala subalpina TaxID=576137 RepID=A0A1L7XXR9_9HELO|nr:uncharacterized protein PAC_19717 [Phialocephala subalpina]
MNEALCLPCQALFRGDVDWNDEEEWSLTLAENRPHHSSLRELQDCGLRDCLLCALIWHEIPPHDRENWIARDNEIDLNLDKTRQRTLQRSQLFCKLETSQRSNGMSIKIHSTTAPPLDETDLEFGVDFRLYHPGRHLNLTPVKPLGPCETTSSPAALAHITHWVVACQMAHYECRSERSESWMPQRESWMPSRLIYVGKADHNVRLVVQPLEIRRYMTLSHCWGQGPTLKLTIDVLEQFMKQIPFNTLPQTYLDAIMVTRHLGIEYLWIDSLCIVQDSTDDWQRECTQMSNVYKNSYCNVAALESIDSHGGLFSARDPKLLRPLIVKADWRGAPNTMWFTKLQLREKHYHETIDSAPLHQRAWVLQERLLAPRNLHFGKHMVYWECRRSIASENMELKNKSNSCNSVFWWPKDTDVREALRTWCSIVTTYTRARLTYPKDRLVAISAVAKETKRILDSGLREKCTYLAGLWSCHLAEQLLWYVRLDSGAIRPPGYRAPSWSWASVDSEVFISCETERTLLVKIHKAMVVSSLNDEYIQVTNGYIQVDCHVWRLPTGSYAEEVIGQGLNLRILWDTYDMSTNPLSIALHLMPINFKLSLDIFYDPGQTDDSEILHGTLSGIVITPTEDHQRFRRVAKFLVHAFPWEPPFRELPASHEAEGEWVRCIGDELLEQRLAIPRIEDQSKMIGVEEQATQFWSRYLVILI